MSEEAPKYYCLSCKGYIPVRMYVDKNHDQSHFVVVSAEDYNKKIDELDEEIKELHTDIGNTIIEFGKNLIDDLDYGDTAISSNEVMMKIANSIEGLGRVILDI